MSNSLSAAEQYQRETRVIALRSQAYFLLEIEKLQQRYDPFIAEVVLLREKIERLEAENHELKQQFFRLIGK